MGGSDLKTRHGMLAQLHKHKDQQCASKEQVKNEIRPRMTHKLKLARLEKEEDKKSAHKSDKLSPTDDCKSGGKAKRKWNSRCGHCSNCGDPNHYKDDCTKPIYEKMPKCKKGVKTEKEIVQLFKKHKQTMR